jgi:biotin carboxyl carrier protein
MKYTVKIANKPYEVEIEDIQARPVIAVVDGQRFEVHPENGSKAEVQNEAKEFQSSELFKPFTDSGMTINQMNAPLPGTIIEVFVKPGEQVESGNVIVVIEAMKMKNRIRSTRSGKISEVLVSAGQTVAHKQVLVRFE